MVMLLLAVVVVAKVAPTDTPADGGREAEALELLARASQLSNGPSPVLLEITSLTEFAEEVYDRPGGGFMTLGMDTALQRWLWDSPIDEIFQQLDTLDLSDRRQRMVFQLVRVYMSSHDRDAGQMLRYFWPKFLANNMDRKGIASVLESFAEDDPAAARDWLDQELAARNLESTRLDGVPEIRMACEMALVEPLFELEPELAVERLQALAPLVPRELFQQRLEMMDNPLILEGLMKRFSEE